MTRSKKWDEMSWYEMVLARQVPEPEWYLASLFGACISRSPKQNRSNICLTCRSKQDKKEIFIMSVLVFKKHFISSQSQSLNLGGRRGTIDDVATMPFHPSLSSADLKESPNPIPVHFLMLSSHLFFCLPSCSFHCPLQNCLRHARGS